MPKLTETYVRKLSHAKRGTGKFWDSEIKGLVLFVGKVSKTWYFQKDIGGQTKRMLIGRYPVINAQAARQTALSFALEWSRGAGKQTQLGVPNLETALETYLARPKLRSKDYIAGTRQQMQKKLKDWMRLPLDEITKAMVVERHRRFAAAPVAANHLFRRFRSVWNHARRTVDLLESPTMAIEWYVETPDWRIIDDLPLWRKSLENVFNPINRVYLELLLFTGFRKTEAMKLEWKNVFEDHIHLPITKNGRSFDLPVVQIHHEILAPLVGLNRKWVFPSRRSASGYISNPEKLAWSPHAHRRTFATVAMEAGVLEEVVGRLLNHTPLSITGQRYMRPSLDALRPAMQIICDELLRRTSPGGNAAKGLPDHHPNSQMIKT